MFDGKKVGVVIPAAGKGKRMGGSQSKQFIEIEGKPIVVRTLEQFQSTPEIDAIVLAVDPTSLSIFEKVLLTYNLSKVCAVVHGGEERQDSVWNGLTALALLHVDIVLIHDAVRPFISHKLIRAVLKTVSSSGAAVVAVRPKDTIKYSQEDGYISETLERDRLWITQTPQAFDFSLISRGFEKAQIDSFYGTDDASLVERLGVRVQIVEGNYDNIKITTPEDAELARLIMKRTVSGNK